ncbi:MAG: glycosyltransferase family 2 protein [Acidithiobacillus sp.]
MEPASRTHLLLIPSYNPGPKVYETVIAACQHWNPVWVVVDGSTDGTAMGLQELAYRDRALRVFLLSRNGGKGEAILFGLEQAKLQGYTHVLTMDSDGQHPAEAVPTFMQASIQNPEAMILGVPIFDTSAPALRVKGRKISNWWANLETLGGGIGDSLFGFRVYPLAPLQRLMNKQRWMRRFDFDPEAAVRMAWIGIRIINLPASVRYFEISDGGVSHFHYLRDNILLTWMHTRLLFGFIIRLPMLLARRLRHPH